MNKIFSILMLLSVFTLANAQTPVLVTDYNEGGDDSFDEWTFEAITFDNKIFFQLFDMERGEELGVMEDDEVKLLKDIESGSGSSEPKNFIVFNDKVYFSAYDAVNGGALWSTDGTEENTKIEVSFMPVTSNMPKGLTIAASGWMYYTKGTTVYRTDGTVNEEIYTGASFDIASEQRSNNYCTYKEEIAFAVSDDPFINIYAIEGDEVVLLATSPNVGSFNSTFGLSEVDNGLIMGFDGFSSSQNTGTYTYNDQTGSLTNLTIAGDEARRLHPLNNEQSIAWVASEGYFLTNGVQGQEFEVHASDNNTSTQGDGVNNVVYDDKMVFHAGLATFEDHFIYHVDAKTNTSTKLFEASNHMSNFILEGQYAFFASGVSNGAKPKLYYVNVSDGTFKLIYTYGDSSFSGPSISVMGVVGDKLYYTSNLDSDIGREIYSIELGLIIDTKDVEISPLALEFTNTSYQVNTDASENLRMDLFTTNGKLVSSETISSNTSYTLPKCEGMCFMTISLGSETIVHKFVTVE